MKTIKHSAWIAATMLFALGCGSPSALAPFVGNYGDVRATVEITQDGGEPITLLSDELLISHLQVNNYLETEGGHSWEMLQIKLSDVRFGCVLHTGYAWERVTLGFGDGGGFCELEDGTEMDILGGQGALSADRRELRLRLHGAYEDSFGSRTFVATITGRRM